MRIQCSLSLVHSFILSDFSVHVDCYSNHSRRLMIFLPNVIVIFFSSPFILYEFDIKRKY